MDIKEINDLIVSVTKWGLEPKIDETNKIADLKKSLVNLYSIALDITYNFDKTDYAVCPDFEYNRIRENIEYNFPDFGFYNSASSLDIYQDSENIIEDAIDDLSDIIMDLLVVKWRIENNSIDDGLWFLSFIFEAHSEQHLINLLNYIKNK